MSNLTKQKMIIFYLIAQVLPALFYLRSLIFWRDRSLNNFMTKQLLF